MISKLQKLFSTRRILFAVVLYSSILIALIVVAAMMMRPVADDYAYFSDPTFGNPFKFAAHYYMDWTGRSSQAFWMSVLHNIFGNKVVIYGTLLQTIILILSVVLLVFTVIRKTKTVSLLKIISVGLLVSVLCIFMTPSVFDSNLWITSSSVYIGSLIGIFLSVSLAVHITRFKPSSKLLLLTLFLITFLGQLFSEPTSVIMIGVAFVAALLSAFVYRNQVFLRTAIVYLLGALTGLIYMYLSPGTRTRKEALQTDFDLHTIFISSITDFSKLAYIFTSHRILIIAVSALILSLLFIKFSKRNQLVITGVAFALSIIIPYVLFATTRYTLGESIPLRAFTVPVALAAIFLAVGVGSLISRFAVLRLPQGRLIVVVILAILIPISLLTSVRETLPVVQATAIREHLYDGRESSIKQQIADQNPIIYFEPLPVLLANSDAVDFYYNQQPPAWFVEGFKTFYGIPVETSIQYENQPNGYCVYEDTPGWLGAKSCNVLQKEQDDDR